MIKTSVKELLAKGIIVKDNEDDNFATYVFTDGIAVMDANDKHLYCIQEYYKEGRIRTILVPAADGMGHIFNYKEGEKLNVRIFREVSAESLV